MNLSLKRRILGLALGALPLVVGGCSSSSSSSRTTPTTPTPAVQTGTVNLVVSDATSEDWAMVGVKVLSVTLTPQGGGADVALYTAPTPAPVINLLDLDQLGEILGNLPVQAGTYTAATITVSGNPGDVQLTASSDPAPGFAGTPGASIDPSQIQILHTTGTAGNLTVPVKVTLDSPLVITENQNTPLDLEFDLSHPAFIVAHVPPGNAQTLWAVNLNGPVRHHPIDDLRRLVLRHQYGNVTSVATNNASLTYTKVYPVYPPTTPETAIPSNQTLSVNADATNGTIYYDVDAKTNTTIMDFSSIASTIAGKYIRVAARYEVDGSLTAVRLWASNSFNNVWISPEGHVLHVNSTGDVLTVENELAVGVPLTVNANTQFYFRVPSNAVADATPIGTGPAFLSNIERGFKVHASVVDPLASPLVAQTVDIEIARYAGTISVVNPTNFTYTRQFRHASDDYQYTLPYISSQTANGKDPSTGLAITGYKWWNFTFPTIVDSGANAVSDFETATNGTVNFGGTVGPVTADGESDATWNDPNGANSWAAPWTVLLPSRLPMGTAATSYSNGSFTMMVSGGVNAIPVSLSTTTGSGTLVYQVDRTNNIITISPVDITTTAGQTTLTNNLVANVPVKLYGIPQANGTIKGYVLFYYTGTTPKGDSN